MKSKTFFYFFLFVFLITSCGKTPSSKYNPTPTPVPPSGVVTPTVGDAVYDNAGIKLGIITRTDGNYLMIIKSDIGTYFTINSNYSTLAGPKSIYLKFNNNLETNANSFGPDPATETPSDDYGALVTSESPRVLLITINNSTGTPYYYLYTSSTQTMNAPMWKSPLDPKTVSTYLFNTADPKISYTYEKNDLPTTSSSPDGDNMSKCPSIMPKNSSNQSICTFSLPYHKNTADGPSYYTY